MDYGALVERFRALESTSARLEKTGILAELFRSATGDELERLVVLVRGRVFPAWQSAELGVSSSLATAAIERATGVDAETIEAWWREEGDLGSAAARAVEGRTQRTLRTTTLDVARVHERLLDLAGYEGAGSEQRRIDAVAELISNADPDEARFVVRTVLGTMRLGVGDGLVRDAIAEAFLDGSEEAVGAVERALDVTNDFGLVAATARDDGREGLASCSVRLFRPIKAMLAQDADGVAAALEEIESADGEPILEYKYDGMRGKAHVDGDEIRLFTRRLEDVTAQFPDATGAIDRGIIADETIVEAEVVGYDPGDGSPIPFQRLSKRIKRKYDVEALAAEIPVTVHAFDLLYLDGRSLLDEPLRARLAALDDVLSPVAGEIERATARRTGDLEAAAAFYEASLAAGQEGIMVKNLDAAYQPGRRVGYALKVKPTMEPLDLVVTRVKWSEGRKREFLGRPYLACRDAETDELLEIGRMHTGFTDAELAELTDRLKLLIESVDGREATVEPRVVIQVEYEEIQESPTYGSGFALRFPRFAGFRDDLGPDDVDTLERVQSLYESQGL